MQLLELIPIAGLLMLTATPGFAQVLNPANGHYYRLIKGVFNWDAANADANAASYEGELGHLATVTDAAENLFLTSTYGSTALHLHWLGGFQPVGSPEPGGGWSWVTGEPFVFQNWEPGEPNNYGNENRIIFDHGVHADGKAWNDITGTGVANGYVLEFDVIPEPVAAAIAAIGGLFLFFRRGTRGSVATQTNGLP
jgi:hypothetical protein